MVALVSDGWRMMLRAELRLRWRAMVMVALCLAIGTAVAVGAAASAERTATAFQRLLDRNSAADLLFDGPEIDGAPADFGMMPRSELRPVTLERVPGVETQATAAGLVLAFPDVPGLRLIDLIEQHEPQLEIVTLFALDDQFSRTIERPSLVRGRLPDPRRADEIFVSEGLAEFAHWSVGDRVTVRWLRAGSGQTSLDPGDPQSVDALDSAMGRTDVVITGIGTAIPRDRSRSQELVLMTPAFGEQPGVLAQYTYSVARLADGADPADVIAAASERGLPLQQSSADAVAGYRDSVRPDVVSLVVVAIVASIVTVLVIGQTLGREVRLGGADNASRRAVGATTGQLTSVALTRVGIIVASGVGAGLIAGALSSGWFLRGAAAAVEPTSGVRIDTPLILSIAAVIAVGCTSLTIWPAVSAARAARSRVRWHPSWLVDRLISWGAPPLVVVGARHALEPGAGRATVPMRTALAVGALGAALAVAALVFTSSLDRLVADPAAYGVTWQLDIGLNYDIQRDSGEPGSCSAADGRCGDYQTVVAQRLSFLNHLITGRPTIAASTPYSQEIIEIDGTTIGVYAMGDGPVQPVITDGRSPNDGEIALGHTVMADLGVRVGDTVSAGDVRLLVVGVALVPDGLPGESLGHGGVITTATAQRIDDRAQPRGLLLRVSHGVDVGAELAELDRLVPGEEFGVTASPRPAQIDDYARIRDTPIVLALSMAAVGTGILTAGVMSAVRRRRHEFALLQALGATRRQVIGSIQTQALVSYGVVLLFGLPIGALGGGLAFRALEDRLGTRAGTQWPTGTLVIAATAVAVAVVVLVQPAARHRAAARPAPELQYE